MKYAPKFQIILLGLNSYENMVMEVGRCSFAVANSVTLLGVTIDSKLKFSQHIFQICQKASSKLPPFLEFQSTLMRNSHLCTTAHL